MTKQATICVGTLGQGIWRSSDGGDTWLRVRHGLYSESAVRSGGASQRRSYHVLVARTAAYTAVRIKASLGAAGLAHERAPRLGPRH